MPTRAVPTPLPRTARALSHAAVLAALLAVPTAACAEEPVLTGRPLLEIDGRGRAYSYPDVPICDPCPQLDPRFVSWRMQILGSGGTAVVSITEDPDEQAPPPRPGTSRIWIGRGDRETFKALTRAMADAQLGIAAGNCSAAVTYPTSSNDAAAFAVLDLDWDVLWFGHNGGRANHLELRHGAPECPFRLTRVVDLAVDYALSVVAAEP
jgi:hypothetical protein